MGNNYYSLAIQGVANHDHQTMKEEGNSMAYQVPGKIGMEERV